MNKYAAMGWFKSSELDNFENGCSGQARTAGGHETFNAATIDELIAQCAKFAGQDDMKNVLLDSCDEAGRLDVQVYETAEAYPASGRDMDEWKQGRRELWLATYTFIILETKKVVLSRAVTDKELYAAA